jgi:hypothetical protein
MSRINKLTLGVALCTVGVIAPATSALADHDHFVLTPNGGCHQVAAGQTAISDAGHGGHHRFHANVHLGATESGTDPDTLGDGHSQVGLYKAGPAPAVCDGD